MCVCVCERRGSQNSEERRAREKEEEEEEEEEGSAAKIRRLCFNIWMCGEHDREKKGEMEVKEELERGRAREDLMFRPSCCCLSLT